MLHKLRRTYGKLELSVGKGGLVGMGILEDEAVRAGAPLVSFITTICRQCLKKTS